MPPEESAVRRLCIVDRSRAQEPTTKPFEFEKLVVLTTTELSNALARFRTLTLVPQPFPWGQVRHVYLADKTSGTFDAESRFANNFAVIGRVPHY